MDFLLVTLICFGIFMGFDAHPPGSYNFVCRDGEEYDMCRSPCETTCDNIRRRFRPSNCSRPCVAGCFCRNGFVRARDNTCVPPENCMRSECPENEEFQECGSPCEFNCTNLNEGIFCTKPCHRGCFCKTNFVRDSKGKCVDPRTCGVVGNHQCPANEQYVNCVNECNTCWDNPFCTSHYCNPGCDCKYGYYRNANGDCVTEEQCSSSQDDTQEQCGVNEVYTNCVSVCNDCISRGRCDYEQYYCTPGCDCKQGFYRNERGACVSERECFNQCGENEIYIQCGPACRETCENYRGLLQHPCKKECVSGCFCQGNYVIGPRGKCIPKEKCPSVPENPMCPPGDVFHRCIPCPNTCDNLNSTCTKECRPGCACERGLVRRHDGRCVRPNNCPKECNENEIYLQCGPACRSTCENYRRLLRHPCKDECVAGCVCRGNYVIGPGGKCIPPENCPSMNICPERETFYQCMPNCGTTCRSLLNSSEVCSTECRSGCFCQPGFVRNDNGMCVRRAECPVPVNRLCPPGEVFYNCVPCPSTCDNLNLTCSSICRPGCACERGLVRRRDGRCIRPSSCRIVCGPNQEFRSCGTACPPTCENLQRRVCTSRCVRGCFCKSGFVLGPGGRCIRRRRCRNTSILPDFEFRRGGRDEEDRNISLTSVPSTSTTRKVTKVPKTKTTSISPTRSIPTITNIQVKDVTSTPIPNVTDSTSAPTVIDTTSVPSLLDATSTPSVTTTSVSSLTNATSSPNVTNTTSNAIVTSPTSTPGVTNPTSTPSVTNLTSTPSVTNPTSTPSVTNPTSTPSVTNPTSTPSVTDSTTSKAANTSNSNVVVTTTTLKAIDTTIPVTSEPLSSEKNTTVVNTPSQTSGESNFTESMPTTETVIFTIYENSTSVNSTAGA